MVAKIQIMWRIFFPPLKPMLMGATLHREVTALFHWQGLDKKEKALRNFYYFHPMVPFLC